MKKTQNNLVTFFCSFGLALNTAGSSPHNCGPHMIETAFHGDNNIPLKPI